MPGAAIHRRAIRSDVSVTKIYVMRLDHSLSRIGTVLPEKTKMH